ncbi:MAG: InlB B-repeat-containing protein [Paludibacteraceae bacterium]|nr:InlB B-repeat-containing protein [Paludibacteraceae bacterium]
MALMAVAAIALTGCENIYKVTFDVNGRGVAPEIVTVSEGATVARPVVAAVDYFEVIGWFKEAECINEWDFASDIVTADITLYAKWGVTAETGMTASKDALGTDGQKLISTLTEAGFNKEQDVYKNGDESCRIVLKDAVVDSVVYSIVKSASEFDAAREYFLENETACAKIFPDNFAGKCIFQSMGAFFDSREESQFFNFVKMSVNPEMFTAAEHVCNGSSNVSLNDVPFAGRDLSLFKNDEGKWFCQLVIYRLPND